jgi:hypothetical protein
MSETMEDITSKRNRDDGNEDKKLVKKKRIDDTADDEAQCGICFENSSIIKHQCRTCKPDAWQICELCNESRLSRQCPFCNGDYAPLLLYAVPGRPLSDVQSPGLDSKEKMSLMIKIKALDALISAGNTLLWCRSNNDENTDADADGRAVFALPRGFKAQTNTDTNDNTDGDDDNKVALISVNMKLSEFSKCSDSDSDSLCYKFMNTTWTMLETAVEVDDDDDNDKRKGEMELVSYSQAAQTIIKKAILNKSNSNSNSNSKACSSSSSLLFLPLKPDYWNDFDQMVNEKIIVSGSG